MPDPYPPELHGYRLYDWRYRWGLSRRQTANLLGLTETSLRQIDTCFLNNPAIEAKGLARIERDLCLAASMLANDEGTLGVSREQCWRAAEKWLRRRLA